MAKKNRVITEAERLILMDCIYRGIGDLDFDGEYGTGERVIKILAKLGVFA